MIRIYNTVTPSPEQWKMIIMGTRNPMNSWDRYDSYEDWSEHKESFKIGPNDYKLLSGLAKAGPDHGKFMRMITVYVDITAPLYWWSEYDTYKIGTVANSCSKMHKLMSKPFEMNDFSFDKLPGWKNIINQFTPDFDYEKEIWKQIGSSTYDVSNMGRIRRGNKILAGSHHNDGYVFATIDGRQIPIHAFVAREFIPNPKGLPEVNHKDGNKLNNSVENLEWTDRSGNQKHAVDLGLQPKGLTTYTGKFTHEQREEIKELWNSGKHTRREIAKMYGVSHTCINDILNNKYQYAERVNMFETVARPLVDTLNELRDAWLRETDADKKKIIWYSVIQLLPSSYNQTRTVMLNYEVLRNMYHARKGHRLDEWKTLLDWIKDLPYSEFITEK